MEVSIWVSKSWKEITLECIINGFKKAEIVYENSLNEQIDLESNDGRTEEDSDIDYGFLPNDFFNLESLNIKRHGDFESFD